MTSEPIVRFLKFIPSARAPKRAERSAAGYLPSRAMRYCDALTSATGYGYWVFPPIDFSLIWDGEEICWSIDGGDEWLPLSNTFSGAVQFPSMAEQFDAQSPDDFRGYSPPFLTALPEVGGIQIWTGLVAITRAGWSLNVRAPANLPGIPNLIPWEGIVETDLWVGPLFNNFRITRTDTPIHVRSGAPFLQVQPIPQVAYADETLNHVAVETSSDMTDTDWNGLRKVLLPDAAVVDRQGLYATTVRKRRRRCPVTD